MPLSPFKDVKKTTKDKSTVNPVLKSKIMPSIPIIRSRTPNTKEILGRSPFTTPKKTLLKILTSSYRNSKSKHS
jgi:hypothetical protein